MNNGPLALIAEDEPILAQALRDALARLWPELRTSMAGNGVAAVEQALALAPDVLFLDIKMPGKSGLEAVGELAEEWHEERPFPLIVFVTAYDDYALEAFEQAAVDYVLKPVADARLARTVARLRERLAAQPDRAGELARAIERLHVLAAPAMGADRLRFIRAAIGNQVRMIAVNEVLALQAGDKYVAVITAQGEALIRTSLKELLPRLDPEQFWQIHRSCVINASAIEAAVRDDAG
ncbi:MAG TPA: LytTR family DNA-binding domain-containing protein, partial [Noviherbaspirillum sp.]|nr:LytTR family DNA-binding domain-containing protein [Noviherbaspirillum sp.]